MEISVIGAGAQGSAIAFILAKDSEVSGIVSADLDLDAAKRAAEETKSDKISAERVDAGKVDDLLRVIKGSDTVVNATLPRFNPNIMKAALKGSANYVDLSGYGPIKDTIPKVLALKDSFKDAGLTAVIHQGGPFTTNVAVRYVADRLDRVDEIRFRLGGTWGEREELIPAWKPGWSPETALTEWIPSAAIYEKGKWRHVPPFSGVEKYLFPEPIGSATVCNIDYEPTYTIPCFIESVNYVDYKIQPDKMAGSLIKMGLASDKLINVKGVEVAPRDVLLALTPPAIETREKIAREFREKERYGCSLAEVKGEKNGKKITHTVYRISNTLVDYERWGTTGGGVAVPAALTAIMLAKGEISDRGVVPPEGLDSRLVLARLAEKGWFFRERITKEIHK